MPTDRIYRTITGTAIGTPMTNEEEILNLRERCHDLANSQQLIMTKQAVQELTIGQLRRDVDHQSAVSATGAQLQSAVEIFTLKLDTFSENLKAHNRIIAWTVALVMSFVLGSLIQSVMK